MSSSRKHHRKLKHQGIRTTREITPKTSSVAYLSQGRAEGVAKGLTMGAKQLRDAEAEYIKSCLAYMEGLDDDIAWGYVMTSRPLLDCLLNLANQFEGLAKQSTGEAEAFARVSTALVAALEAKMPGARGRQIGKRAVDAVRVLAGRPIDGVG